MKKVMGILLVLLISCGTVLGTQNRELGLGVQNWMIMDDYNIWLNPAQVVNYQNRMWVDLGTNAAGTQWGGASLDIGMNSVLAIFIERPYAGILGNTAATAAGSDVTGIPAIAATITGAPAMSLAVLTPQNKIDFFYGLKLSPNLKFGALVNYGTNMSNDLYSYDSTTAATNDGTAEVRRASTELNVTAGIQMANLGPVGLDAAIMIGKPSVKNTYVEASLNTPAMTSDAYTWGLELSGASNFGALARAVFELNKNLNIIGNFTIANMNTSSRFTRQDDTNGDGTLDTNLLQNRTQYQNTTAYGVCLNYRSGNVLLVGGVTFNNVDQVNNEVSINATNNQTTQAFNWNRKTSTTPLNLGLEYEFSPAFTARIGASKNILEGQQTISGDPDYAAGTITTTAADDLNIDTTVNTAISVGVTVEPVNNLVIDAVVNNLYLFTGSFLASGTVCNPVARVSVLYRF